MASAGHGRATPKGRFPGRRKKGGMTSRLSIVSRPVQRLYPEGHSAMRRLRPSTTTAPVADVLKAGKPTLIAGKTCPTMRVPA